MTTHTFIIRVVPIELSDKCGGYALDQSNPILAELSAGTPDELADTLARWAGTLPVPADRWNGYAITSVSPSSGRWPRGFKARYDHRNVGHWRVK